MAIGGVHNHLSNQIENLYLLLNGRTLQNKNATYEEEFKSIRCAVLVLAGININIFEKYCQKINNYKYLDVSYRSIIGNFFKLNYADSDLKVYEDLIKKGLIEREINNDNLFIRLTQEGENLCYSKLTLLESLKEDYFSDSSIQDYYIKDTEYKLHTDSIAPRIFASITDPKKKRVDAIIREISNWPESYTNVSRYNNEPSEDIFNPLNDNRVVGRGGRFKIQIIIVDDDQGTTLPFKLGLESQGFAVDTFNDPKLALSHFHSGSYDLALIDVRMEGMNGFELVQEMKQIDKKLKVCFITSFTAYYDSLIQEYPNMEHKCFIQKPISIDDLIKHMERVLHY